MHYTLKKIQEYKALSEGTIAFSAKLYLNNKLVAHCENSGKGGCNQIHFDSDEEYLKFHNHIKTLPDEVVVFGTEQLSIAMNADNFISTLLDQELAKKMDNKHIRKYQKNGFKFVLKETANFSVTYYACNEANQLNDLLRKSNTKLIYSA